MQLPTINHKSDTQMLWSQLEDSAWRVRYNALKALGKLEPATLAPHADAVVERLEEPNFYVRMVALQTLAKLEPAMLAQHAGAVVARLEDSNSNLRKAALETLATLEPMTLAQLAGTMVARLEDPSRKVRATACHALETLPPYVRYATRGVDCEELFRQALDRGACEYLHSQLLGRLAWYRCRIRLRVRRLSLYWYALPYRPSGPGHARDVEAWNHMIEE